MNVDLRVAEQLLARPADEDRGQPAIETRTRLLLECSLLAGLQEEDPFLDAVGPGEGEFQRLVLSKKDLRPGG